MCQAMDNMPAPPVGVDTADEDPWTGWPSQQAFDVYQQAMPHPEWSKSTPSVSLTSYTDDEATIQPDGSTIPNFTNVLAWAVIYRGVVLRPLTGQPTHPGITLPRRTARRPTAPSYSW